MSARKGGRRRLLLPCCRSQYHQTIISVQGNNTASCTTSGSTHIMKRVLYCTYRTLPGLNEFLFSCHGITQIHSWRHSPAPSRFYSQPSFNDGYLGLEVECWWPCSALRFKLGVCIGASRQAPAPSPRQPGTDQHLFWLPDQYPTAFGLHSRSSLSFIVTLLKMCSQCSVIQPDIVFYIGTPRRAMPRWRAHLTPIRSRKATPLRCSWNIGAFS